MAAVAATTKTATTTIGANNHSSNKVKVKKSSSFRNFTNSIKTLARGSGGGGGGAKKTRKENRSDVGTTAVDAEERLRRDESTTGVKRWHSLF